MGSTDNTVRRLTGTQLVNQAAAGEIALAQPGTEFLVELPGQPDQAFGPVSHPTNLTPVLTVRELVAELHMPGLDDQETDDLPSDDLNRQTIGKAGLAPFWTTMSTLTTYPGGAQTWCQWTVNGSLRINNFRGSMKVELSITGFSTGVNNVDVVWTLESSPDDVLWSPLCRIGEDSYKAIASPDSLYYTTGRRVEFIRDFYYRVTCSRLLGPVNMSMTGRTPVLTFTLHPTEFS